MSENPFVQEEAGRIHITDAGYELLRDIVTDSYGNVYVFTKNADPVMVAAAMARSSLLYKVLISRSGNWERRTLCG